MLEHSLEVSHWDPREVCSLSCFEGWGYRRGQFPTKAGVMEDRGRGSGVGGLSGACEIKLRSTHGRQTPLGLLILLKELGRIEVGGMERLGLWGGDKELLRRGEFHFVDLFGMLFPWHALLRWDVPETGLVTEGEFRPTGIVMNGLSLLIWTRLRAIMRVVGCVYKRR